MAMKGLTELNVFRGTYKEVQAKETRDMTIYLAWDTQEIFIGNKLGTKVRYGSGANPDKSLKAYFASFKDELYKEVKNYSESQVEDRIAELLEEINNTYNTAKQELSSHKEALSAELNERLSQLNSRLDTAVNDYNNLINSLDKKVNDRIDGVVTTLSNNISNIESDYNNKISSLESTIKNDIGKSIEDLENNISDNYYNKDSMNVRYYTKTEIDKELAGIVYGEDISLTLDGYVKTDNFEDYKDTTNKLINNNYIDVRAYTDEKFNDVKQTVTKLIGGAPAAYDTFKEIAEYIERDGTASAEMLASIQRVSTNINDLSKNVNDNYYIKSEIDKKITDAVTGGQVDLSNYYTKSETTSEINKAISSEAGIRSAAINDLSNRFGNYYNKTEIDSMLKSGGNIDLTNYATKVFVNTAIDNVNARFSNYATTGYVDTAIKNVEVDLTGYATEDYVNKALENVDVDLTGYATEKFVENSISPINQEISNIKDTKLDASTAEETYAKKSDIPENNSNISYMTGDDILLYRISLSDISEFKPTFCILNSTNTDDYLAGGLYYYDSEAEDILSASSGGAIELKNIISTLRLSISSTDSSEEINSNPMQLTITASADNTDAVEGNITLKIHTSSETVDLSDKQVVTKSTSIPRNNTGTYTISLTATAKAQTKKYKYIVNGSSKSYSIYKPCFIGTDEDNLTKLGKNYKGTWGSEYTSKDTSGKTLYMYTTGKINSITMSGFGYSYSLEDSAYKLTVNGVECTYYKYNLGSVYSELADIVVS